MMQTSFFSALKLKSAGKLETAQDLTKGKYSLCGTCWTKLCSMHGDVSFKVKQLSCIALKSSFVWDGTST